MVLEALETRALLAYTPLGYSLPDLTVSGYTSSTASWGGPLTVTANVQNLGASTLIEPTQLLPGAASRADSTPTTLDVFVSSRKHATKPSQTVLVASLPVPGVTQNSFIQLSQTINLPFQPAGFPGDGGKVYVSFFINPNGASAESDFTNNHATATSNPVVIEAPFPELTVTTLGVPPVMQPGDTIAPTIRVANIGPASTSPQGPVTVALVASTTPQFNAGSSIVAAYTVPNIPGASQVSSGAHLTDDENLNPQNNIVTIQGAPVTLPVAPRTYFLGVVIDPLNTIKQLKLIGGKSANRLSQATLVGPPIKGLPPAGVRFPGGGANNLPFQYPPNTTPSGITTNLPQIGITQ
jgi:hypothetical protein